MAQIMEQKIRYARYGVVLSELINFPLCVSSSKEMGDRTRFPRAQDLFIVALATDRAARSWVIMGVIAQCECEG